VSYRARGIRHATFSGEKKQQSKVFRGSWIYRGRLPDARVACCLAEALGVTVEYLVRKEKDETTDARIKETEERKNASANMDRMIYRLALENSKLYGSAQLKYFNGKGIPAP
jgi:hypothetical protein